MNRSETITTLAAALVKFSGKMVKVAKDSTNPHFRNKYASLSTIIEATQKPLSECGLTIIQLPSGENQLETILLHESGEFISETYKMTPSKNDPQGLGSAITYQRRYAYGAILNLNIDEDDDGNKASEPAKPQPPQQKLKTSVTTAIFTKMKERMNSSFPLTFSGMTYNTKADALKYYTDKFDLSKEQIEELTKLSTL